MTVNKNDVITIPKWLVIVLTPIVVAGLTTWGVYRSTNAKNEQRLDIQEKQTEYAIKLTEKLDNDKVSRKEFVMLQSQLNRIEDKLDNKKDK